MSISLGVETHRQAWPQNKVFFFWHCKGSLKRTPVFPVPNAPLTENTQRRYEVYATGWTVRGSNPHRNIRFFCFPTQPYRLWDPSIFLYNAYRSSFQGLKRPGREANHQSSSSAEVKNEWSYTSAPPLLLNVVDRKNFTFFIAYSYKCQCDVQVLS